MTRDEILIKIMGAKEFAPHKIEYYKEMLREYDLKNINLSKTKFKRTK